MSEHLHTHSGADQRDPEAVLDPVCGMTVDPRATDHHAVHDGVTHHFCSAGCKEMFLADPDAHAGGPAGHASHADPAAQAEASAVDADEWTCPMHPEVRQDHPGSCPLCGMALEPVTLTVDSGPSPELADMTRRFWIALALSLPVFALEMGSHLVPAIAAAVDARVSV